APAFRPEAMARCRRPPPTVEAAVLSPARCRLVLARRVALRLERRECKAGRIQSCPTRSGADALPLKRRTAAAIGLRRPALWSRSSSACGPFKPALLTRAVALSPFPFY